MKLLDKDGDYYNYITKTFPSLSMEKHKVGIFDGPQIRKLMQNQTFTACITVSERAAWCLHVSVLQEFPDNTKTRNYWNLVDVMIQNFQALGATMTIKLHYLLSYLDYFPENLGDASKEQEDRFHQDIRTMKLSHDGRLLLDTDP